MKKKFFALIFGLGLMAMPLTVLATGGIPAFPMNFYGAITINGEAAPVGTVVSAYNGATLLATATTVVAGSYGNSDRTIPDELNIKLSIPDTYTSGTMTFKVNSPQYNNNAQLSNTQTHSGVFVEFTNVSKNLAFTGATPTALTSIDVTPATASVVAGSTQQFTATGTYTDLTTANITSSAVWSSATASVATIGSASGLATGVSAGTSVITASYTDATNGALTDTATLTVTAAPSGGHSASNSTNAPTATTTTTTTGTASGAITASKGGTVSTTVGSTKAQVTIPADALSVSGVVSVQSVAKSSVVAPVAGSGNFLIGGLIFDFKVDGKSAAFKKPVTLTFTYSDLQVEGLNEKLLTVFRLNTTNNTWEALNTTVDTAANTITAQVDHFTVFAIMVSTGAATVQSTPAATTEMSLAQMTADAQTVITGDVNQIIAAMGVKRDLAAEANYNKTVVAKIVEGSGITAQVRNVINNFVTYGTKSTKILGAGERGGVVNSFRAAFGKLPATVEDWNDVIKIGNGRWPNQRSVNAEKLAAASFKKIYLRDPNRTNSHDDAAVTVMAYGLRPANRNLNSEKTAIKTFKNIYKYAPTSAMDWDAVRAIAYSGAVR